MKCTSSFYLVVPWTRFQPLLIFFVKSVLVVGSFCCVINGKKLWIRKVTNASLLRCLQASQTCLYCNYGAALIAASPGHGQRRQHLRAHSELTFLCFTSHDYPNEWNLCETTKTGLNKFSLKGKIVTKCKNNPSRGPDNLVRCNKVQFSALI